MVRIMKLHTHRVTQYICRLYSMHGIDSSSGAAFLRGLLYSLRSNFSIGETFTVRHKQHFS